MKNVIFAQAIIFLFLFSGCATLFKGYFDDVEIINPPEGLQIYTKENVRIPLQSETIVKSGGSGNPYAYVPSKSDTSLRRYFVLLRSSEDHTLALKYSGMEKMITVHKKIGFGWILLDLFACGFPLFIDGYTGNWHHFDSINEAFE